MEKIKRFFSCLLVVFVFANYLFPSIHAFEHHKDTITVVSSNELNYNPSSNIFEHCCFCDIYFNLDYSDFQSLTYALIVPIYIYDFILDKEKTIIDLVLFRKKIKSSAHFLLGSRKL